MTGLACPQHGSPGVSPCGGPDVSPMSARFTKNGAEIPTALGAWARRAWVAGRESSDSKGASHADHQSPHESRPVHAPHLPPAGTEP